MAHEADRMYEQLSEAQRAVVDPILQAVETRQPLVVFVKACGGTGKTFCFNTVLNRVRSNGKIALAMAWSGIAALLLVWGRMHVQQSMPRTAPDSRRGRRVTYIRGDGLCEALPTHRPHRF